jgi:hypothetical protein
MNRRKDKIITPREQQVLDLRNRGFSGTEIAEKLGINPFTVRAHTTHLIQKGLCKPIPSRKHAAVLRSLRRENQELRDALIGKQAVLNEEGQIMWLLVNANADKTLAPFAERYQLFSDPEKAYAAALEAGFDKDSWIKMQHPAEMKVGVAQITKCGGIDLMVLRLEAK